jgi:hypothetical protein
MCDVPSKRAQLWAGRGRHLATDSLVLGGSSWQKQLRIRSGSGSKFVHRKKRYIYIKTCFNMLAWKSLKWYPTRTQDNIADMKLQKDPPHLCDIMTLPSCCHAWRENTFLDQLESDYWTIFLILHLQLLFFDTWFNLINTYFWISHTFGCPSALF